MTKSEYLCLLEVSCKQPQLNLIIQTICATGIRVSEFRFFTVEAIRIGEKSVRCKKTRTIYSIETTRIYIMTTGI